MMKVLPDVDPAWECVRDEEAVEGSQTEGDCRTGGRRERRCDRREGVLLEWAGARILRTRLTPGANIKKDTD